MASLNYNHFRYFWVIAQAGSLTLTDPTLAEELAEVRVPDDQTVVFPTDRALSPTGGLTRLRGNLAPDGAIVKVAGLHWLTFNGGKCIFLPFEDSGRSALWAATLPPARSSSFAMKARAADLECWKCSRRPPPSAAKAWASRWL